MTIIQKLFTKEMNRREFLAHLGAGLLTLVGISGVLRALVEYNGKTSSRRRFHSGYSSGVYGGQEK